MTDLAPEARLPGFGLLTSLPSFVLELEPGTLTWPPDAEPDPTLCEPIATDVLWMAFQPIVRWSEQRVIGYEALLRAKGHGDRFPSALYRRAIELGAAREFGRAVRRCVAASMPFLPLDADVFVNVEREEVLDDLSIGADDPLAPWASRVILEIAERGDGIPCGALFERLSELRARGYRIAIDDLGAGHNGLAVLAELEVDAVKIDMSLVRRVDSNATKRRVVSFIHELCRETGTLCIDEGIETEGERDALLALGADLLQGHLLGHPQRLGAEVR